MSRYTAEQARHDSGRSLDEKIDALLDAIEIKAKDKEKKERSLKTSWEHKEDRDLWVDGGYIQNSEWKEAKKILEDLGYTVKFVYKETQFVDMYTLVEW